MKTEDFLHTLLFGDHSRKYQGMHKILIFLYIYKMISLKYIHF